MRNRSLLIFLFCLVANLSFSQTAILGTNPPSVKWQQIKTPYFRVIFDAKYEEEAQRTANILETVYEPAAKSLGKYPKRSTIILQNQNTISNGFVTWAPRRSEFNTYPSQQYYFSGNNAWMELLSVHEYRHLVQYEKSLTGFNKVMYYLFGQATVSGFSNIAVPDWFWEGDAVVTETALTQSGRGRIPYFGMAFRANVMKHGPYSYNKQYLRSYKDYVPDHYVTGYYFTSYLRKKYGAETMAKVTNTAWSLPFVPFMFSNALKIHTGKFLVKNYKEFVHEMEGEWKEQIKENDPQEYTAINERKNEVFTQYQYPYLLPDKSLLVLKQGLGDIETFVKILPDGSQEKVFVPGFMNPAGRVSTNGEKIVWNEFIPDVRWDARVFSDIKLYDMEKGKERRITRKKRYSSAAISPNGERIAAVQTDPAGKNSLVVLDLNGKETASYHDPENALYIAPEWDSSSEKIVAVKLLKHEKSVVMVDPDRSSEETLFEVGEENISYPRLYDRYLFYNSPYSGIGNIYVMDRQSGTHYRVTNSKFGAYNPYYDAGEGVLYFNEYNAHGFDVAKINFDINKLEEKSSVDRYRDELVEAISQQEGTHNVLEEVTEHHFPIENYSELKGMINPHSWGITYGSTVDEYHFFVSSQDILSTTQINAGYTYNLNEEVGQWTVNASYQGFFPVIDLNVFQGERNLVEELLDTARGFSWKESGIELGVRLPFSFTRDKYAEALTLEALSMFYNVEDYPAGYPYEPRFYERSGSLQALKLRASYSRLLKTSTKDVNTRWGQRLRVFFLSTPFEGVYQSTLFAAEGTLFFPGLFKHHSLFLRGSYQWEDKWNYTFESPLTFPRGYSYSSFDNFYSLSTNYSLPLLYPDLGLGPVLYIARVRANLFYDFGYGEEDNFYNVLDQQKYYNSVGADVLFDFNIMRFLPRLSVGFRAVYLPEEKDFSARFLIGSLGF